MRGIPGSAYAPAHNDHDWDPGDVLVAIFATAMGAAPRQIAPIVGKGRWAVAARMRRVRLLDRRLTQEAEALQRTTSNGG